MKILLIKLSALGDVLASTPFFRLIKLENPGVEIHHLVMRGCHGATECNPWLDRQIVTEKFPSENAIEDLRRMLKLWASLANEHYDLAIIFHRSFLFQILCKLCGITRIIGFKSARNWFLDHSIPFATIQNRTIQEYQLLLHSGIKTMAPDRLEFYPNQDNIDPTLSTILPKTFVACNPGGGNIYSTADNRIWAAESYADWIRQLPYPVVLLGLGAADAVVERRILKMVGDHPVFTLVNRTNLDEAAEVLRRARLYVGNDSGLLYLAAALGVPTLGLFGPTQRMAANPLGHRQHFIEGRAPCAPCYNPYDGIRGQMYLCQNNICMQHIPVSEVVKRTLELCTDATMHED